MPETTPANRDPSAFDTFIQAYANVLRANDRPPKTPAEWVERRSRLRQSIVAAMGALPAQQTALEPRIVGSLKRPGYRIDKLIFQSQPDIWVTSSMYVPEPLTGKAPAVLAVHGHWPIARRDPVVQARCLGLVKLGFIVLAVDAFGSGERSTNPTTNAYHGALHGSALWPAGHTLLGMQVYDNRRAVDYLLSRPEVDGTRLGITGASGGGNQSMNAGALDDRFAAVVPVCSVGSYRAYLKAACCVCEMLPGALRFTEEGDVLGLVAPRALLVISASRDAYQFSVGQAVQSLERARAIYQLSGAEAKLAHAVFDSPHAYNQPMRETMYGWMTKWLKNEGNGQPIAEPAHVVETPADLACYPEGNRPKGFLLPPAYAARSAREQLAKLLPPTHVEEWEASTVYLRRQLWTQVLGGEPRQARQQPASDTPTSEIITLHPEPGMSLPLITRLKPGKERRGACILLHLAGKDAALANPLAQALLDHDWHVCAPDLRATGTTKPEGGSIHGAADHNSAEHALWVGRPLLGQWLVDVYCVLDWLTMQPTVESRRLAVVGLGQAGLVALLAGGLLESRISAAASVGGLATLITEASYADGTSMGLLAPGLLRFADVPHIAAMAAPRRLLIVDGVSPQGDKLDKSDLGKAFAFTRTVYGVTKRPDKLVIATGLTASDLAAQIGV